MRDWKYSTIRQCEDRETFTPPVLRVISQTSVKIELLAQWRNPRETTPETWLWWLLHMVEVGLIKTVIVDSPCRIRRNSVNLILHKSLLEKYGAKLIVLALDGGDIYG